MSLSESSEPDTFESESSSNLIPVDNAKLMTSINLISICVVITTYLKKLTAGPSYWLLLLISIAIFLFILSAFCSLYSMINNSCEKNHVKDHLFSPQSIIYFLGLIVFLFIVGVVITQ